MMEENSKGTSWGLNQQEENRFRENLIQCAQTRLRYLQLEEELKNVLHSVVSMQTKLETLRMDTSTTLDTVTNIFDASKSPEITQKMNRQMDVLEKRLASHKLSLDSLNKQTDPFIHSEIMEKSDSNVSSLSMSRLSSFTSIFNRQDSVSTCATSINESHKQLSFLQNDSQISDISLNEQDHPFYDLAGKRSFATGSFCGSIYNESNEPVMDLPDSVSSVRSRRRQRRQRHQHYLQQERMMISQDMSSFSDNLQHPLSPSTPPPYCPGSFFDHTPLQEWYQQDESMDQRNVLDEAMSFLDGLSEDGDDGGFGEDMYLLLLNPDLCCKPLDEIETTMQTLRKKEQQTIMLKDVIRLLKPTTWIELAIKYSRMILYSVACTALDWCRFLCVLAAAVIISILKGPDDIKRNVR